MRKWLWVLLPFYLFTFLPLTALAQSGFNPTPPGNPGANYWYSEKGEVVVDDFTPGSLATALNAAIGDADPKEVSTIVVAGVMNNRDIDAIRKYTECTLLDLSRCTGINEIIEYSLRETKLETVYLPATIEKINRFAFAWSDNLKAMSVYALTPPELNENAFYKNKEDMVLYVPAVAIPLYMEAEGWKNFTILPIQKDIRSLTVSLPQGTSVNDYEGMWLELQNTNNGQSLYFVMTDKRAYTFNNIIYNTTWDVTLRNERGNVFGEIKNVEVHEKNVSVAFAALSKPQNAALKVTTPEGTDVTSQVQVSWTDAAGNYLSQQSTVKGLPEGMQLTYKVTLPKTLATVYNVPVPTTVTVNSQLSTVNCQLSMIPAATLTGTVTDAQTGSPLQGSTITATQTFGAYNKTLTATTAADGSYTLALSDVPTTVTVAADGYLSQTADVALDSSLFTLRSSLLPLTGAVISLGFTFTPCAEAGARGAETEAWYTDCQNIDYTIYNVTQGRAVSQFQVQYPQMVLMEDVSDGDVLRLTATSRANRFLPVTCEVTIADQQAKATFDIVELGKIQATVLKTTNAAITATLYDGAGRLVASRDYADAKQTFEGLTDGSYTLLSMGKSEMFNTIGNLDGLSQTKLTEGTYYVLTQVAVQSGQTSVVDIAEVPLLDESKLYYTGEGTSFTVNKAEVVAGNYVTLTGRLDFKAEYAEDVSQVQLLADIPENCQFVENSVMVGNNVAAYTLNGQRLTIPLESYTERIRFCIVPTTSGTYTPSGMVQFALSGESITQPIGSAPFSAEDITLVVPDRTSIPSIPMRGVAVRGSKVDIYDGEVLIGQTLAKGNGGWFANCPLNNPDNLSTHYIKAVVTTPGDVTITSETRPVEYDKNGLTVKKVMMYHNGHGMQGITFDFQNPSDKVDAYQWNPHKNVYTFTIDFTDNDTTLVSDVVLYAKLQNGRWEALDATYDEAQKLWVAAGEFSGGSGVVNVCVGFLSKEEIKVNHSQLKSIFTDTSDFDEVKDYNLRVDALFANYTGSDADSRAIRQLCEEVLSPDDAREVRDYEDSLKNLSDAEINARMETMLAKEMPADFEAEGKNTNYDKHYDFTAGDYHHIYRSCEGLTVADVPEGSQTIQTEDGTTIYIYTSKTRICYVDFANNIWYEVTKTATVTRGEQGEALYNWESIVWDSDNLMNAAKDLSRRAAEAAKETAKNQALHDACKDAVLKARYAEKIAQNSNRVAGMLKASERLTKLSKVAKGAPIIDLALNAYKAYNRMKEVDDIFKYRNACKDPYFQPVLDWYQNEDAKILKNKAKAYHAGNFVANALAGIGISALAAVCPLSLFFTVPASVAANLTADHFFDKHFDKELASIRQMYEKAMRNCLKKQYSDWLNSGDDPYGLPYTGSDKDIIHDPSGFVYEAVESNRLEGVTATIYHKERVEDIYGDWTERVVKWNAEEYGQENPLFTDAEGNYRWDVPQGQWQVTFEKQGYETARTEWLPVPPPQLDINIAMRQNVQPLVKDAHAYEDAVVVEFDKYMKSALLTTENIRVMDVAGEKVFAGAIELMDETDGMATKARFKAAQPFGLDEVMLIVSNRVMSYAGIRMQDDYTQVFAVGGQRGPRVELRQIMCDEEVNVGYGEPGMLTVTVLPVGAAAGQTLKVASQAPVIVGVETSEVVLDQNGSAQIAVRGNLPGAANVTFSVEACDLTATTLVNVEELFFKTAAAPVTNIASGVYVEEGTEIRLSCTTEGAVIYYTLDGSCPCDDTPARRFYDGTPIVVSENTTITAMAAAPGYGESSVVAFTYFVGDPTGIQETGVRRQESGVYDLQGRKVAVPTKKGIYITNGQKVVKK
ncbi:MAG: carboxypeptidase regulatory-like domain-containing protein [Prevotella sp.]|nr:carboxypeptidase regulatory-like domain-containing protein [Prevotella sp.]